MECNVCGKYIENENANFCENCGNSFRENFKEQSYQNNTNPYGNQSNNNPYAYEQKGYNKSGYQQNDKREQPVSFKSWLFTLSLPILLLFIPIPMVGPIAYIVILFVWAFGNNTNPNKKNWARANLVVSLVVFVLSVIFAVFIFTAIVNGTFPMEGLEGFENFGGMTDFY